MCSFVGSRSWQMTLRLLPKANSPLESCVVYVPVVVASQASFQRQTTFFAPETASGLAEVALLASKFHVRVKLRKQPTPWLYHEALQRHRTETIDVG